MHVGERLSRLYTSCMNATDPKAGRDLRKRVTAIYWRSSGRGFKSCQPDTVMSHDIGIVPNLRQVRNFFRLGPFGAPVGW